MRIESIRTPGPEPVHEFPQAGRPPIPVEQAQVASFGGVVVYRNHP